MLVCVQFTSNLLIFRQLIRQVKVDLDTILKAMIERKSGSAISKHTWSVGIREYNHKMAVKQRYNENILNVSHPDRDPDRFCNQIANLRIVYGSVNKSITALNNALNPQILIITALALVSVVLSFYLVIQLIIMKIWRLLIIVTIIRLAISIFINYVSFTAGDQLLKSVFSKYIINFCDLKTRFFFFSNAERTNMSGCHSSTSKLFYFG